MNIKVMAACIVAGTLMLPIAGYSADGDTDRSSPKAFVKDSVITTQIKTELVGEKRSSLIYIKVDTDQQGKVTLGGSARNQTAIDKAVSIAKRVKGVTAVQNNIAIKADL